MNDFKGGKTITFGRKKSSSGFVDLAQILSSVAKSESWYKPKRVYCLKRPFGATGKICDRAKAEERIA
jgi:hypothetical protein